MKFNRELGFPLLLVNHVVSQLKIHVFLKRGLVFRGNSRVNLRRVGTSCSARETIRRTRKALPRTDPRLCTFASSSRRTETKDSKLNVEKLKRTSE